MPPSGAARDAPNARAVDHTMKGSLAHTLDLRRKTNGWFL
jgi:hypothetical protein